MIGEDTEEVLIIGKDISWDQVHDNQTVNLLRIVEFNPWSQVHGKKVKSQSRNMPHGTVMLESPEFESRLQLFLITHSISCMYMKHFNGVTISICRNMIC